MSTNITEALTADEIIEFIHLALIAQIRAEDLQEIAENILLIETYLRVEKRLSPQGIITNRFYSITHGLVTRIDFGDIIYEI